MSLHIEIKQLSGERENLESNSRCTQNRCFQVLANRIARESEMRDYCSLTLVAVEFSNNQRKFRADFLSEGCLLGSCIKQSVSALALMSLINLFKDHFK